MPEHTKILRRADLLEDRWPKREKVLQAKMLRWHVGQMLRGGGLEKKGEGTSYQKVAHSKQQSGTSNEPKAA
ncbi:hypothetical protein COCNU_07G012970 [Cocos nucifera]|uniref:Uncharacterized protein n=1 Tax=Cocos nucifera TaxID=13894 RepID=A0A8K0IFZ9_COCNU|nr:hypothetical protein COCNU_07G012970 [Cocos nucifera]